MRSFNRPTHYSTSGIKRVREISFYLDKSSLRKIEAIADFDNQTRSRGVERAVYFFYIGQKKQRYKAYEESKKAYKTKTAKKQ